MGLINVLQIDFTGKASKFEFHEAFGDKLIVRLRNPASEGTVNRLVVMIDNGFAMDRPVPHMVKDHLNLTGTNPLVGPNHPCGPRFPVINGIYVSEFQNNVLSELPQGVAAGLNRNCVPASDELNLLKSLGADFYCYNMVPSIIVAAHAGWKVIGIVIPEGTQLNKELLAALTALKHPRIGSW